MTTNKVHSISSLAKNNSQNEVCLLKVPTRDPTLRDADDLLNTGQKKSLKCILKKKQNYDYPQRDSRRGSLAKLDDPPKKESKSNPSHESIIDPNHDTNINNEPNSSDITGKKIVLKKVQQKVIKKVRFGENTVIKIQSWKRYNRDEFDDCRSTTTCACAVF